MDIQIKFFKARVGSKIKACFLCNKKEVNMWLSRTAFLRQKNCSGRVIFQRTCNQENENTEAKKKLILVSGR